MLYVLSSDTSPKRLWLDFHNGNEISAGLETLLEPRKVNDPNTEFRKVQNPSAASL
jgi:hypothetical protein